MNPQAKEALDAYYNRYGGSLNEQAIADGGYTDEQLATALLQNAAPLSEEIAATSEQAVSVLSGMEGSD